MLISTSLKLYLILSVFDKEWLQPLDYEHIPFICHKGHEKEHRFRYFPLNKHQFNKKPTPDKDVEGFQTITTKRHNTVKRKN